MLFLVIYTDTVLWQILYKFLPLHRDIIFLADLVFFLHYIRAELSELTFNSRPNYAEADVRKSRLVFGWDFLI